MRFNLPISNDDDDNHANDDLNFDISLNKSKLFAMKKFFMYVIFFKFFCIPYY